MKTRLKVCKDHILLFIGTFLTAIYLKELETSRAGNGPFLDDDHWSSSVDESQRQRVIQLGRSGSLQTARNDNEFGGNVEATDFRRMENVWSFFRDSLFWPMLVWGKDQETIFKTADCRDVKDRSAFIERDEISVACDWCEKCYYRNVIEISFIRNF